MIFGICLLILIAFLYILLIKGILWKLIIGITGWFGLYTLIQMFFSESQQICCIFADLKFTWAEVIPTIILLLAMAYTREY